MCVRTGGLLLPVLLFGLAFSSFGMRPVSGQPSKEDKVYKQQLAAIKQQLSYKGKRETTWYVMILRDRARIGNKTQVTARFAKIQGQDEAAQQVYSFIKEAATGIRDITFNQAFADTEKGRKQADDYLDALKARAKALGYAPAP